MKEKRRLAGFDISSGQTPSYISLFWIDTDLRPFLGRLQYLDHIAAADADTAAGGSGISFAVQEDSGAFSYDTLGIVVERHGVVIHSLVIDQMLPGAGMGMFPHIHHGIIVSAVAAPVQVFVHLHIVHDRSRIRLNSESASQGIGTGGRFSGLPHGLCQCRCCPHRHPS